MRAEQQKDARRWLRANGYSNIADQIDEIITEWKLAGKKTRRNWWEILAGDAKGQPRKVAGRIFPIIKAAQRRQGLQVSTAAISNKKREHAPAIRNAGRWPNESPHQ